MNILYKSKRVGKFGQKFILYKFRTMKIGSDKYGASTAGDDPRLTRIGGFLRKFKIDELPGFLNVIKGDMTLVGPRPEVPCVVDLMTEQEKNVIFSVKPGLVDLATLSNFHEEDQLAGQKDPHQFYLDNIWPEKKRLQILYVKNRSIWLDIRIILQTILRLCRININILKNLDIK